MSAYIEIFTNGQEDETFVAKVKALACPKCTVLVYDLAENGQEQAETYQLKSFPAVVLNGTLVDHRKLPSLL